MAGAGKCAAGVVSGRLCGTKGATVGGRRDCLDAAIDCRSACRGVSAGDPPIRDNIDIRVVFDVNFLDLRGLLHHFGVECVIVRVSVSARGV